jgi:methylmalonyl-CoA carboxyltransferase small subunit
VEPAGGRGPAPGGSESGDESKLCRSPLAGAVARVDVEVGQEIGEGDVLLVLEAMKMETVITAPFAGTIKSVNAEVGDAVAQGQVLVEIE